MRYGSVCGVWWSISVRFGPKTTKIYGPVRSGSHSHVLPMYYEHICSSFWEWLQGSRAFPYILRFGLGSLVVNISSVRSRNHGSIPLGSVWTPRYGQHCMYTDIVHACICTRTSHYIRNYDVYVSFTHMHTQTPIHLRIIREHRGRKP